MQFSENDVKITSPNKSVKVNDVQTVCTVTDLLTLNTKHTSGMLLCQKEEVNHL